MNFKLALYHLFSVKIESGISPPVAPCLVNARFMVSDTFIADTQHLTPPPGANINSSYITQPYYSGFAFITSHISDPNYFRNTIYLSTILRLQSISNIYFGHLNIGYLQTKKFLFRGIITKFRI